MDAIQAFAEQHPELFPKGPMRMDFFTLPDALDRASREGAADASSFLVQSFWLQRGKPAPAGVYRRQLDPAHEARDGRGRRPENRYRALVLWLAEKSTKQIAEILFPDDAHDVGQAKVKSLVKSAQKDWEREMLARNATGSDDDLRKVGTEIIRDRLKTEQINRNLAKARPKKRPKKSRSKPRSKN